MATQTIIPIGTDDIGLPILVDPKELYDQIMEKIEPELMSRVVPLLQEKYRTETPKEAKARAVRYVAAFKKYDIESQKYMEALHAKTKEYARTSARSIEAMDRESDDLDLSDIETAINEATSTPSV